MRIEIIVSFKLELVICITDISIEHRRSYSAKERGA